MWSLSETEFSCIHFLVVPSPQFRFSSSHWALSCCFLRALCPNPRVLALSDKFEVEFHGFSRSRKPSVLPLLPHWAQGGTMDLCSSTPEGTTCSQLKAPVLKGSTGAWVTLNLCICTNSRVAAGAGECPSPELALLGHLKSWGWLWYFYIMNLSVYFVCSRMWHEDPESVEPASVVIEG